MKKPKHSIRLLVASWAILAVVIAGQPLQADTLSGSPIQNNGSGGIFFDLTPTGSNLTVDSFNLFLAGLTGTSGTIELWTRPGSYVGFESDSAGWSLVEVLNATSNGTSVLTADISLTVPFQLTDGTTTGFLLHGTSTDTRLRYFGTTANPPSQTTWFNDDLTLFAEHGRTGTIPFGSTFTPRTFAGNVNYTLTPVPEPGTLLVLGACGALATLVRRRRP